MVIGRRVGPQFLLVRVALQNSFYMSLFEIHFSKIYNKSESISYKSGVRICILWYLLGESNP